MISNLMPNPKMEDSGVLWLGIVPEHWKVLRETLFRPMRHTVRTNATTETPSVVSRQNCQVLCPAKEQP